MWGRLSFLILCRFDVYIRFYFLLVYIVANVKHGACLNTRRMNHFFFVFLFCSSAQERGESLLLRYATRWGKEVMRGQADVSIVEPARHCAPFTCPCQYIERHLKCKPRGKSKYFIVCDGLLSAERCDSFYFIFYSLFLILGVYALYMVNFQSQM